MNQEAILHLRPDPCLVALPVSHKLLAQTNIIEIDI